MGVIIGVIVLGIGATYLYFEAEKNERKRQKDSVTVSISYDLKACSAEYPLLIAIKNGSKKRVNKVSWNIGAFKPGYSNNIVDYGYSSEYGTPYSSDKILNSGQGNGLCYKVPSIEGSHDPKLLNWSAVRKSIDFNRE